MKKIKLSAEFLVEDTAELLNAIDALINTYAATTYQVAAVDVKSASIDNLTKNVWIYFNPDETDGYYVADGFMGQPVGEIDYGEIVWLRQNGVCTQVAVAYPRSDRYGVPDIDAEMLVADHGFAISANGVELHMEDFGDDTLEQYWICIAHA